MKNIRPFGWFIIALNAYFLISFIINLNPSDSDIVIGIGFFILVFWLAIMNTVLYVLYRITASNKRECPVCGFGVKTGLTKCNSCNYDFKVATAGDVKNDKNELIEPNKKSELSVRYNRLHPVAQVGFLLVTGAFILYFGSWITAPYSEFMDNVHCGLDSLVKIPCTFRFQP